MDQVYLDKFHSRYNGWFTESIEVIKEEEKIVKTKSKKDDSDYKGTD